MKIFQITVGAGVTVQTIGVLVICTGVTVSVTVAVGGNSVGEIGGVGVLVLSNINFVGVGVMVGVAVGVAVGVGLTGNLHAVSVKTKTSKTSSFFIISPG